MSLSNFDDLSIKEEVLMEKDTQRKRAVEENDVRLLESLEDGTEWYKFVEPETGNTFLHITVLREDCNRDVFHYLLRFIDFPFDHKNNDDRAVLELCWNSNTIPNILRDEFVCELIKKGASLDCVFLQHDETLLHQAAERHFVQTSKLLLNMGYDVNARRGSYDFTPLWYCLLGFYSSDYSQTEEMVCVLLSHGADPTIGQWPLRYNTFEYVGRRRQLNSLKKEIFPIMFDEHTSIDIHLEALLILANEKSHMFRKVVKCTKNVIVAEDCLQYTLYLFSINNDDLKLLIKKFPKAIKQLLTESINGDSFYRSNFRILDNVETILGSDLREYAFDFIQRYINNREFLASESPYFFLSYGIRLNVDHLIGFDTMNGFDELLKLLQHTEIEFNNSTHFTRRYPIFIFFYDPHADLHQILSRSDKYYLTNVGDLLDYFAHPKLREFCTRDKRPEVVTKIASQPDVPLLLELARTALRKSLASSFTITNTSQFFTLVNKLPLPTTLKKVLTFEKKLYK